MPELNPDLDHSLDYGSPVPSDPVPTRQHDTVVKPPGSPTSAPDDNALGAEVASYLRGLREIVALSAVEWASRYGQPALDILRVHFAARDPQAADAIALTVKTPIPAPQTAKEYIDEFLAHAADALHAYMRLFELEPDWDLREDVAGYIKEDLGLLVIEGQRFTTPSESGLSPRPLEREQDSASSWDEETLDFDAGRPQLLQRPRRTSTYLDGPNARLANSADLDRYLSGPESSKHATRLFGVAPLYERSLDDDENELRGEKLDTLPPGAFYLDAEVRTRHMLCAGPTGAGKTTKFILPILRSDIADPNKTVIVLDSKGGELLPYIQLLVEKYRPGSHVKVIDFLNPDNSLAWNPLGLLHKKHELYAFAGRWVNVTETKNNSTESEFWRRCSNRLLGGLLWSFRSEHNVPAEQRICTLHRALQLASADVKELKDYAARFPENEAIKSFTNFIYDSTSQNAYTVQADLQARLAIMEDDRIATVTSHDEVRLDDVLRTPTVLVLRVNEAYASHLKPLTNLFFSELVDRLFLLAEVSPGGKLPVPVSMIIEEFASAVGRIPEMERFLNIVRSRGVAVTASVQSVTQVQKEYGPESAPLLAAFCSKIFFPGVTVDDATYASSLFGRVSVEYRERTEHKDKDLVSQYSGSYTAHEALKLVQRDLLTPHEIRAPFAHGDPAIGAAVTFSLPDTPPFQAFLTPVYKLKEFIPLCEAASKLNKLGRTRESLGLPPLTLPELPSIRAASSGTYPPPTTANGLPAGITDTRGWTQEQVQTKLEETRKKLDWDNTTGSARKWWEAFENENKHRLALVLRLAEELANRKATITEFFLAYVYSNTDNIQANLCYLDYTRLKKEEECKKKDAAARAREAAPTPSSPAPGPPFAEPTSTATADAAPASTSPPPPSDVVPRPDNPLPTANTDLTFVRCASCRSLVPAAATCRTCGATLTETASPDHQEAAPSEKSRPQEKARPRRRRK